MNINKLLSQSTWKGKEVGKAVLLTMIELNKGNASTKQLFSKEDIRKMVKGLANEHERSIYNRYIDLNNALIEISTVTEGYSQQALHGYYKYFFYVIELSHALESEATARRYPVIMTEKQYQELYSKAREEKRAIKTSFKDIIFDLLSQYTEEKAKPPKQIKDALEALKKEPVTSDLILGRINEVYGLGYQQFPDGRRSDQITEEERMKAVEEIYLAKHKITIDGRPATLEEAMREVGEQRIINHWKRVYDGEAPYSTAEKEIAKAYKKTHYEETQYTDMDLEERKELSEIVWHYYDTPPEGLTKWDIIAGDWDMTEIYGCRYAEDDGHEKEHFNEFIKDYPKLFTALKEELSKYKGLAVIAETKPANYHKDIITWGELADAGIEWFIDLTTPTEIDLTEGNIPARQCTSNGIAIIKEGTYSKKYAPIDKNGYYIDPHINHLLEKLTSLPDSVKDAVRSTRKNLLEDGLRMTLAYNSLIDILMEVYATPELAHLKKDEARFNNILTAFNNLVMSIYENVWGTEEERKVQRDMLKDIYPVIDLDKLRPTEAKINEVKERIADQGVTRMMASSTSKGNIHSYIVDLAGIMEGR